MAKSSSKGAAAAAAPKVVKPSAQRAAEIAKQLGVSDVWANDKCEYFTSENLAMLSVDQDKKRLTKFSPTVADDEQSEPGADGDKELE